MYWIDTNPDAPTFTSVQEALDDWARDHTAYPGTVYFEGGHVALEEAGQRIPDYQFHPRNEFFAVKLTAHEHKHN